MCEAPILVVGGGPAGASAAASLAEAGLPVLLIEQRDQLGGAIHRLPAPGNASHIWRPARHRRNWARLTARLQAAAGRIETHTQTVFLGVDGQDRFLLDDRSKGLVFTRRLRAAIIAVGAVETIRPFSGWELPGVMTAGGAQVLLKETGRPLEGPILIAGSGPLLPAIAAQLAKAGNPPVAVLERGRPWNAPGALARLALSWAPMSEAATYAATLARSRVPYRCGATVTQAEPDGDGLKVGIRIGEVQEFLHVRHLLIHDGIEPNRTGIPFPEPDADVPVLLAGDGREALGADAAILDGHRAAMQLLTRLGRANRAAASDERGLQRARDFQANLARALHSEPVVPAPETVICRCEGRIYADLATLAEDASAREIRLMGRFGLGACQGRFCGPMIAALRGQPLPVTTPPRWPLRPVSVAALARLTTDETE
ncbi:FAD-dependent oxidoreductase [Bosea sp. BH3]|uniref:FAD-dependent oxidoreductase n=1 Tax=Bosea sp. BH3 TaxID=2871701 RepID=UPI0021CB64E7|nr:FAD-dependent oxidoreductase [Bosea sp. BH3]MCU4179828.1 FAD-dependent oxidoreductase [Bosea sp. BH3]